MMHPKMLRRILAVISERLTPDGRYEFFTYFKLLKRQNEKERQNQRRTIQELLLVVLSAYLPERWWRRIERNRTQGGVL